MHTYVKLAFLWRGACKWSLSNFIHLKSKNRTETWNINDHVCIYICIASISTNLCFSGVNKINTYIHTWSLLFQASKLWCPKITYLWFPIFPFQMLLFKGMPISRMHILNWSLQPCSQDYNLASHTTYTVFV